ncbi:MAG: hypothetical protein ABIH46_01315, partial [Chloroflexota bacterium]
MSELRELSDRIEAPRDVSYPVFVLLKTLVEAVESMEHPELAETQEKQWVLYSVAAKLERRAETLRLQLADAKAVIEKLRKERDSA